MMSSRRESPRNSWHLTWEFARLIGVEVLHEKYWHSSWEAIESFAENSYSGKKWFPVWICEMISRPNRDTPDRNVSLQQSHCKIQSDSTCRFFVHRVVMDTLSERCTSNEWEWTLINQLSWRGCEQESLMIRRHYFFAKPTILSQTVRRR